MNAYVLGILVLACTACTSGPEPVRWGTDTCEQCRMVLDDRHFAAELVLGGRSYKFDGVDELAKYMAKHPGGTPYVLDAVSGAALKADQAVYLGSPELKGPMGGHVVAFGEKDAAQAFAAKTGLKSVEWPTWKEALGVGR